MAEAYRGLTIRFGGDTSELRRSLAGVNSAIRSVQSDVRRLDRALRLDPSNVQAASQRVDLLGQRTELARVNVMQLRQSIDRLDSGRIADAARSMGNASLAAERARQAYNEVNATLENVNRSFKAIAANHGIDAASMEASQLADELHGVGAISDDVYQSYRRLADAHNRWQDEMSTAEGVVELRKYNAQLQEARSESEAFARSLQDAETALGRGSRMSASLKSVKESISDASREAGSLEDELRRIDDALKLDPSNTDLAARRMGNLAEQAQAAQRRVDALESAISEIKSSGIESAGRSMRDLEDDVETASSAYRTMVKNVGDAEAALDSLRTQMRSLEAKDDLGEPYRRLQEEVARAERQLDLMNTAARESREAFDYARAQRELRDLEVQADEARAAVRNLNDQMQASSKSRTASASSVGWMGSTLSASVTPAVTAGISAAVDAAETIDSAYRDMRKTVNGTEDDFEALRDAAVEFSQTHITSADTILEIEAMGGQLGIAVDQLEEFAVVASNLDIATNLDADEISQAMGQLNNVLNWGEGDMERFGDALVRLGNNMPAQEDAIVDITKRIGAAAHMYGMTTPEILSWATAVASTGQNCEAAGTAISNSLAFIEGAVAAGGDDLQALADVAGMTADEFANLWNTNASDAFLAFIEGLRRIDSEGGSVTNTLAGLGITAVRQRQALEGLTSTTDVLNDSLAMSEDAWNGVDDQWGAAGDAAREAAQKSEGFSGALGILRNNMAALGDQVGQALLPFIEIATDAVATLVDALEDMPDSAKTAAVVLAGIAAAAGPVMTVGSAFLNLRNNMKGASTETQNLTGKQKVLKTVSSGLKGGLVTLATAGVGLLVDYIAEGIDHANTLAQATDGLEEAVSGPIVGEVTNLADEISNMGTSAAEARQTVDDLVESQAQLAASIEERHSGLQASNAVLEEYARTVGSLAGQNLGEEDVARLQIAVDGLNDSLGTNYEVVQNQDGAYRIMADGADVAMESIMDLVNAMQMQAAMDVYQQDYEDILGQRSEALDAVAEAQEAVNTAQEKYDQMPKPFAGNDEWDAIYRWQAGLTQANNSLTEAQQSLDSCDASIQRVNEQMVMLQTSMNSGDVYAGFVANNQEFAAGLDLSSYSLMQFRDALSQTGISVEQLSGLTSQQMIQLAQSFDGSAQSIIASLITMNGGTEEQLAQLQTCFDENGVGIAESLSTFAQQLRDSGLTSAADYVQAFADSLSGSAEQAGAAAEQVADAAVTGTESGVDPAGDVGDQTTAEYSDAISDGAGEAETAGSAVADSAVSGLSDFDTSSVGYDFSSGFANGIASGSYLATNAAAQMAADAVSAARATLDEHSPSRVAFGIGDYFTQGMALGIENDPGAVYRAAQSVAGEAARAARYADAASWYGDAAASIANRANSAHATQSSPTYLGATKADIYDAVVAAMGSVGDRAGDMAVYIDGRELSRSIARHMDAELGELSSRRSR